MLITNQQRWEMARKWRRLLLGWQNVSRSCQSASSPQKDELIIMCGSPIRECRRVFINHYQLELKGMPLGCRISTRWFRGPDTFRLPQGPNNNLNLIKFTVNPRLISRTGEGLALPQGFPHGIQQQLSSHRITLRQARLPLERTPSIPSSLQLIKNPVQLQPLNGKIKVVCREDSPKPVKAEGEWMSAHARPCIPQHPSWSIHLKHMPRLLEEMLELQGFQGARNAAGMLDGRCDRKCEKMSFVTAAAAAATSMSR